MKETVVSVRLDSATEEILERCKKAGQFSSTTDTVIAGLQALARELRHKAIRQEIQEAGEDVQGRGWALIDLDEWQTRLERADRGEL